MAAPTIAQRPTLTNTRIRSPRDALLVFHGVAMNILPLITRRLDIEERRAITSGNVYVWEERGVNNESVGLGMERWTDGMGWGPSRVRDEFLFYHQKNPDDDCNTVTQMSPWARVTKKNGDSSFNYPGYSISSTFRHLPETRNLIKQTYSVHVTLPADRNKGATRKWHLTAYFSQEKLDSLHTVDMIPQLRAMPTPDGWFRSARSTKSSRREAQGARTFSYPERSTPSSSPSSTRLCSPHSSDSEMTETSSQSNGPGTPDPYVRGRCSSPPPPPRRTTLVPLEHLQKGPLSRRDPLDEQLLRRLTRNY
ncbi:hypothetical protein BDZ89DRAFT_1147506 [Hymenopellis radicata]|nr:hypothetical protein BDZ89DRAFT_1147506 [Hymenopellis radicata]